MTQYWPSQTGWKLNTSSILIVVFCVLVLLWKTRAIKLHLNTTSHRFKTCSCIYFISPKGCTFCFFLRKSLKWCIKKVKFFAWFSIEAKRKKHVAFFSLCFWKGLIGKKKSFNLMCIELSHVRNAINVFSPVKMQITTGTNCWKDTLGAMHLQNSTEKRTAKMEWNETREKKYATLTIKWLESHKVIYLAHKLW